jgi:NAD(P) transhydrogenase subunit alpha
MKVVVPKESYPGELRVALIPANIPALSKAGLEIWIEAGAGIQAGFPDSAYEEKGGKVAADRATLLADAGLVLTVRSMEPPEEGKAAELSGVGEGQIVIGFADPLSAPQNVKGLAEKGLTTFSMELMPRITRAQSMDALSSMATIAGYKAVVLAADSLPRMFPLLMTAAGTIAAAKVFIVGAGVAGLQAIATAHRLGAIVQAYDVRPAVREQVESLGGKFVELPLETTAAEDRGGYAKAQDEEFYRKQRELMGRVVADSDVVITTAAVPGKKAPVLVTREMIESMRPGSVVVDLAAERGGNCELTRAGETLRHGEVTILGPINLPSRIPYHASQMYSKNITTFLLHLVKEGEVQFNLEDEITRETLMTRGGEVVNARLRELLGLPVAAETPKGD